jgi:ATP-dependent RNA helicase DeaD
MPFPKTNPALERALAARAYNEPTAVQSAVLADEAAGRDLLVSAQTGSGKTVAFGLAMAATLLGDAERFERAAEPLALIIAPTRELAVQVHTELSWLYADAGARVVSCVGGMDARAEQRLLANGCHIVVGTPGRLRDHLERGRLDISALKAVVLDEADEMLDLGFREDLEFILDATPKSRRTLLFSATIAREIANLARDYQQDALRIDTQVRNQAHGDIEYRAVRVAPTDTDHAIVNLLRFYEARAALIFCHTREAVRHLHASLSERGFSTVALSGELSQSERTHALQALRDGRARVCVATDVAARGLDLPDLSLVIHADLPREKATLLHRSGRTGRAGRKGICALIVPFPRRRHLERLLMDASIKAIWQDPPKAEEIRARDQERMLEDPAIKEPATPEDLVLAQALLAGRPAEEIAAALIRFYRSRLPAPEDMFDSGPADLRQERYEDRSDRKRRDDGARGSDRSEGGPVSWFRLDIGRENNADPKWLIPLICRRGHITKREIGFIKIFDRETKFEIAADVAQRFMEAVEKSGDQEVKIQPTTPFEKDRGRSNADRLTREDSPRDEGAAARPPRKYEGDKPRAFAAKRSEGFARPRDDKKPFRRDERSSDRPALEGRRSNNPKFAHATLDERGGDRPKYDRPKFDKPKFDGPKFGKSKFDKPKFDGPKSDRPKSDRPKFDKPKFESGGKPKKQHRKGQSRA